MWEEDSEKGLMIKSFRYKFYPMKRNIAAATQAVSANSDVGRIAPDPTVVSRRCPNYVNCMNYRDMSPYAPNPSDSCRDPKRSRNGYCSLALQVQF